MPKKKKLFCERGRLFYAISVQKEIGKRHLKNLFTQERFATEIREQPLENPVAEQQSHMIKRAPGVELRLQENKAENIRIACRSIDGLVIHPGESFSFWKRVGKPSRRRGFRSGRVIRNNVLQPGVGGGLCNLGNTIHRMVLHSPLTVTEFHHHSDALAPDEGEREPLSAGTAII